jgi:tRNA(Ile)-lysidine synthetase-like protein
VVHGLHIGARKAVQTRERPGVITNDERLLQERVSGLRFLQGDIPDIFRLDFIYIYAGLHQIDAQRCAYLRANRKFIRITGHKSYVGHKYKYTKKMDIYLEPGRYVVAVSGGVDSVVLLHVLAARPDLRLTVAHFDHGIRPDSREDRLFVQELAASHGLPFVYDEGILGPKASEEVARKARYDFLHRARQASGAQALVTAHHQDDALETAIINILRGTGRRGLTSLKSTDIVKRPMLHISKTDIRSYADKNNLKWHEDSTNADQMYLRNHIRHRIVPRLPIAEKARLHRLITDMHQTNTELDSLLAECLKNIIVDDKLRRHAFIMLPHAVALEVMAAWLRANNIRDFDKTMLERMVHAAKIYSTDRRVDVTGSVKLSVGKDYLALVSIER